jgi:hypothetical protein
MYLNMGYTTNLRLSNKRQNGDDQRMEWSALFSDRSKLGQMKCYRNLSLSLSLSPSPSDQVCLSLTEGRDKAANMFCNLSLQPSVGRTQCFPSSKSKIAHGWSWMSQNSNDFPHEFVWKHGNKYLPLAIFTRSLMRTWEILLWQIYTNLEMSASPLALFPRSTWTFLAQGQQEVLHWGQRATGLDFE